MQMHKLQYAIVKKVNVTLDRDLDKLMLGTMLPNLTKYEHNLSHFRNDKSVICDINAFYNKYAAFMNDDVVLGYFMHLLIDNFFKDFMNREILTFDDDGNVTGYIFNGVKKQSNLENVKKLVKQDYQLYGIYLMNNGLIDRYSSDECAKGVKVLDECKVDSDILYDTIIEHNLDIEKNKKKKFINRFKQYKVLPREMYEDLINKCVDYICSIVKAG